MPWTSIDWNKTDEPHLEVLIETKQHHSKISSNWVPPTPAVVDILNEEYRDVDSDKMRDLFLDWPTGALEAWANNFNASFSLIFNIDYHAHIMLNVMSIKVIGNSTLPWDEYHDAYKQARIMEKLESNL